MAAPPVSILKLSEAYTWYWYAGIMIFDPIIKILRLIRISAYCCSNSSKEISSDVKMRQGFNAYSKLK